MLLIQQIVLFLQLVTVTKEMCGLRGAAKTDFDSSVSRFTQQVTYISKLVGKANDTLQSMALTGHLLTTTSLENFQTGKLTVRETVVVVLLMMLCC